MMTGSGIADYGLLLNILGASGDGNQQPGPQRRAVSGLRAHALPEVAVVHVRALSTSTSSPSRRLLLSRDPIAQREVVDVILRRCAYTRGRRQTPPRSRDMPAASSSPAATTPQRSQLQNISATLNFRTTPIQGTRRATG